MHSSNPFVAGLSLTTVGNLATPDIARDLMMEVEKHLRGGRPYLVKKVTPALMTISEAVVAFIYIHIAAILFNSVSIVDAGLNTHSSVVNITDAARDPSPGIAVHHPAPPPSPCGTCPPFSPRGESVRTFLGSAKLVAVALALVGCV